MGIFSGPGTLSCFHLPHKGSVFKGKELVPAEQTIFMTRRGKTNSGMRQANTLINLSIPFSAQPRPRSDFVGRTCHFLAYVVSRLGKSRTSVGRTAWSGIPVFQLHQKKYLTSARRYQYWKGPFLWTSYTCRDTIWCKAKYHISVLDQILNFTRAKKSSNHLIQRFNFAVDKFVS